MRWLLDTGVETLGPLSGNELEELLKTEALPAGTMVRETGSEEWNKLAEVKDPLLMLAK